VDNSREAYGYDKRNVVLRSIYKTFREVGRRVKEIQEAYKEIPPPPLIQ